MSNRAVAKGREWENAVARYLRHAGFNGTERRAKAGRYDKGDLIGIPGFMVECKAGRRMDLAEWMEEVRTQTLNAKTPFGALVVKRPRKRVENAYVVMFLEDFARLVKEWYDGRTGRNGFDGG